MDTGILGFDLPDGLVRIGDSALSNYTAEYLKLPASVQTFEGSYLELASGANIFYGGSEEQFRQLMADIINNEDEWTPFFEEYKVYYDVSEIIRAESMDVVFPDKIAYDQEAIIDVTVTPDNITIRNCYIETSNSYIIDLYSDDEGIVHLCGIDDGTAVITVKMMDGSGLSFSKEVKVTGNPKYNKYTFTVAFNANGGSGKMKDLTGINYRKGKALTANAFKRKGYKFIGWNTRKDGSGISIPNKGVAKELTKKNKGKVALYAQWEKVNYTINYVLNGGEEVDTAPFTRNYTVTDAVTLQKPVREYYVFSGWYSDSKFKTKVTAINKGTAGNKTLYAKWTPYKYKISFVGNGATGGKMADMTGIAFNAEKTLTSNGFTKRGYRLTGWNTVQNPTEEEPGTVYANKAKVKGLSLVNGDTVKLYAQWEIVDYKIYYNLNGGTNNEENPDTFQVITDTITLQPPTRTGYTFKGWYSDKKFKTKVTAIKKGTVGNKSLYAKWTANKYTVIFNKNDEASPGGPATGTMKNQTLTYNSSTKLTANAFKKTGYTMTGWNTEPDGSGMSFANAMAKANVSPDNGAKVTLYAQWKLTDYKINYNLPSDAINHELNPATYTMVDKDIEIQAPTRPGYDFLGWYADSKFKKAANLTIAQGSTGAKTFYPKWKAHKYTVVFDKNDEEATGTMKDQTLIYGSTAKLTANTFKKTYYTMTGWNSEPDGSGKSFTNQMPKANVTTEDGDEVILYAQWAQTNYTIKYTLNGGKLSGSYSKTYTHFQTEAVVLPTPTRSGYTFQGWYTDSKFKASSKITEIPAGSSGNKTVYAKWKKK